LTITVTDKSKIKKKEHNLSFIKTIWQQPHISALDSDIDFYTTTTVSHTACKYSKQNAKVQNPKPVTLLQ